MKRYFPIMILVSCAAALIFGIVDLFELRFEAGDVYPPYSSLRADPLGAMALYESLEKIPGLSVWRDFSDSSELPEEPQTVYLHLAGDPYEWNWLPPETFHDIQDFLARGGRLAITFYPMYEPEVFDFDEEDTNWDEGTNSEKSAKMKQHKKTLHHGIKKQENDTDDEERLISLEDKWDFNTTFRTLEQDDGHYLPMNVFRKAKLPLPDVLQWHSGVVFTNLGPLWQVIYARGTNAVIIERKFGEGSVVMATDSYFVSNEAMTKDRHPDLLAWFIGPSKNVVFDESHFGIVDTSGVATLMRKYRLEGLMGGLILLAVLFIWKNSLSLVPPLADSRREDFVTGRDSATGFVNLLRRSVARRDILATCFAEWKKSTAQKGKISTPRFQQAEAIFSSESSASGSNPIETYKKISETLGTRNPNL